MDQTLEAILHNTTTLEDKLQAYAMQVFANGARGRLKEALDIAYFVLKELDVILPENPGRITVLRQYRKTRRMLHRKSDRWLLNCPYATNAKKIAAMQILSFARVFSYLSSPEKGAVAVFRQIQLALEFGMSACVIPTFAAYGYIASIHLGNRKEGIRYGQTALRLLGELDEEKAQAWLPRTYFMVNTSSSYWAFPIRNTLEPLMNAHRCALRTGDMEFAMHAAYAYLQHAFLPEISWLLLRWKARSITYVIDSLGQTMGMMHVLPVWQMISDFMDIPLPQMNLTCLISDAQTAFDHARQTENVNVLWIWYLNRAIYSCLIGEHEQCLEMTTKSIKANSIMNIWRTFYEGLSFLAMARISSGCTRWSYIRLGRKTAKQIKQWARDCRENCLNKQRLLEAEIAALFGCTNTVHTLSLFHQSIQAAENEGFLMEVGLAYERLALYCRRLGTHDDANAYFAKARNVYDQWGSRLLSKRMSDYLDDGIHRNENDN